jgi:hypothetical protein
MKQADETHSLLLARIIGALDRIERRRGRLGTLSKRIRSCAGRVLYTRYYGPSPWMFGRGR